MSVLRRLVTVARLATGSAGGAGQLLQRAAAEAGAATNTHAAVGAGLRSLHASPLARHGGNAAEASGETILVTFVDEKDGSQKTVQVPLGENMLEAAHANDVDLEGACEGSLACSTCHVIVTDPAFYAKIPEADDDENDMLDLAFGLTDTSRLGCQVKATRELDGITLRIPSATRNFAVDGHVPKPH